MSFPSDMTAPPAGALEACLALLEMATPGEWEATVEVFDKGGWEAPAQHITVYSGDSFVTSYSTAYEEFPDDEQNAANATALVAAVNYLRQHGPALLAALRLREWRPIESAPEDTPIWLVDAENTMWVGVHVYVENEGYAWTNCYRDFDYHNGKWQTSTADWDDDYQPIGWQPLPEPPTADDLARVLEEGE